MEFLELLLAAKSGDKESRDLLIEKKIWGLCGVSSGASVTGDMSRRTYFRSELSAL